jgi:enhancing lycopene biosynthesis protein 2
MLAMKKNSFILGILALALVFELVLTGCNLNGDEPPTVTTTYTLDDGSTLEIYDDGTVKLIPGDGATGNTKTGTYDKDTGEITFGESADTNNTLTVTEGGTVTGTVGGTNVSGTEDKNDGNGGEFVEMFNGKASNMDITEAISADTLISMGGMKGVSNLSDFIKAGGELYINGNKITSGSTMIQPNNTVKIMVPKGFLVPVVDETASDMGITGAISADTLISLGGIEGFSNLSGFRKVGGKLYINNKEVTSGSTMIQPNNTVRIMVPVELFLEFFTSGEDSDPSRPDDDDNQYPDPDGNGDEFVEMFNGTTSDMGITEAISADVLISMGGIEGVSNLSDFRKAGGELYINNKEVTDGSTMIQPTDTVRIMVSVEFLKIFGEGGEDSDPSRPDGNGGNFSGTGLDASAIAIRNMKRIFTVK